MYYSDDGGGTWQFRSRINDFGAPTSLVRMQDGRLVAVYGYRLPPYGVRAAVSEDEGETWNPEIILRDDGGSWDLGYPQAIESSRGKVHGRLLLQQQERHGPGRWRRAPHRPHHFHAGLRTNFHDEAPHIHCFHAGLGRSSFAAPLWASAQRLAPFKLFDTHAHFYTNQPDKYPFQATGARYGAERMIAKATAKPMTPEAVFAFWDQVGIERGTGVQYNSTYGTDNSYLLDVCEGTSEADHPGGDPVPDRRQDAGHAAAMGQGKPPCGRALHRRAKCAGRGRLPVGCVAGHLGGGQ